MVIRSGPLTYSAVVDSLRIKKAAAGQAEVLFLALPRADLKVGPRADKRVPVRLLQIDENEGLLTTFPRSNLVRPDKPVTSKYSSIKRLSFSEFHEKAPSSGYDVISLLEDLPSYCVKDPQYGLGFVRTYRAVVDAIQNLTDADAILISRSQATGYDPVSRTFVLSESDMETFRLSINRVDRTTRLAANEVNATTTYNRLAEALGRPRRRLRRGRSELRRALTALANEERPLTEAEQAELVETLTQNVGPILQREPAMMDRMESGIAAARARALVDDLRQMMKGAAKESEWQRFFQQRPFLLSMVFGRPFVTVAGQASVGGTKIDGSGDKITDFLAKNVLSSNAALVEIKTPGMRLLNKRLYRGGVYTPSSDLVGAINQALDQKRSLQQNVASLNYETDGLDLRAFHVQAYVLAGRMPCDPDRAKSFELFRHNSKDVVVMTFDELLKKVEGLCEFLVGGAERRDDGPPSSA